MDVVPLIVVRGMETAPILDIFIGWQKVEVNCRSLAEEYSARHTRALEKAKVTRVGSLPS